MTRLLTAVVLAAPQPGDYDPSTGKGPEWGKAAPIGLLVILLLGIALFFLLRSFTRQLKKVPASFDTDASGTKASGTNAFDTGAPPGAGSVARVPAAPRAVGDADPPRDGTDGMPNGRADQAG